MVQPKAEKNQPAEPVKPAIEFKPVEVSEAELKRCKSHYDAERIARSRFERLNPLPERPAQPETVRTEPPRVVKLRMTEGLWTEMEFDTGGSTFNHAPDRPSVSTTLVHSRDQVVRFTLTPEQFLQFKAEIERVAGELAIAMDRFSTWQAAQAVHEDTKVAWDKALHRTIAEVEAEWYEAHPEVEDDEDY